ncbi:hypothetical protein GCM10023205_32420 [Yinghuangia aomiensis]|uniref:DUF1214 domain-containing protein n=1 Tax=Yinghuangia aomiensis TaxID=676205 RepID=A0ABP9HAJ1_9ACTN
MSGEQSSGASGERTPGADVLSGAAWREFCTRMADVGDRILGPEFPGSDRDRAEGFRHLANQVACWLTYQLAATDPRHPALFTHNNLVYRWGGPNVDQNARRAPVAGDGTYRLSVAMNACEKFIVQIKAGNMHMGVKGISAEVDSAALGIGPGDTAEILVCAERPDGYDGPWIPLAPEAAVLHVRDFYYDWKPAQPAMFALERLDNQGEPQPPLTPERVAEMLDGAAAMVENSVSYWNTWVEETATAQPPNTFSSPDVVEGGVQDVVYAFADVRVGPGEALVVEVVPDESAQWNAQLQSIGWFESLDFPHRTTCVNHREAYRGPDGHAFLVIAASDPGVPNWLDTEGRDRVFCTHRWVGARSRPTVRAALVPLAQLREHLPADTPTVSAEERAAQIRARAAHVAWRFRA